MQPEPQQAHDPQDGLADVASGSMAGMILARVRMPRRLEKIVQTRPKMRAQPPVSHRTPTQLLLNWQSERNDEAKDFGQIKYIGRANDFFSFL